MLVHWDHLSPLWVFKAIPSLKKSGAYLHTLNRGNANLPAGAEA